MDKRKQNFILTWLFFALLPFTHAQKLISEGQSYYRTNQEVADALTSNNTSALDDLLTKNISSVNDGVGDNCPLLYKSVELCLANKISIEMVKVVLKHHPNYYNRYNNESPLYCILRYIATHPKSSCGTAEDLFFLFYNLQDFDVNARYSRTPPPVSFLLSTNRDFLNGRYDPNYISADVVIALVEKGASVNSRDRNSSTLLTFATESKNQKLIDYCLGKNVDFNVRNAQGMDAFCIAVRDNQPSTVEQLLRNGYTLTESKIASGPLKDLLPNASQSVVDVCFNWIKSGVKDISSLRILKQTFPSKFIYFITDGFRRENFKVSSSGIPELVGLFDSYSNDMAQKNLRTLKEEYVHAASNLAEFDRNLKVFPIYPSIHYTKEYFQDENSYLNLKKSLQSIRDKMPSALYNKLIAEADNAVSSFINEEKNSVQEYVAIIKGYPSFFKENPSQYKTIETKAYQLIKGLSNYYGNYSVTDYHKYISEDKQRAIKDIVSCDAFIGNFSNAEYIEEARVQRRKAEQHRDEMDKIYSSAYSYYKYLTSSYTEYIEYIRDHGNTPPYTINNNKITIKFSCYSKGSKGQDLYASFNETYYLKNDGGMYCIEEIAVISPRRYRDSSLAKAVRKAVLEDFCDSRNISFTERYYQLRYAVEYLSKNYKGKWWERPWGNPNYGY